MYLFGPMTVGNQLLAPGVAQRANLDLVPAIRYVYPTLTTVTDPRKSL